MTLPRPNILKLALPALVFLTLLGVLTVVNRSSSAPDPGATRSERSEAERNALRGDAHLQKFRETADASYFGRAARSYRDALRSDPRNLTAVIGAGTLAGARHEFSESLRRGLEARRLAPYSIRPYPVIADAQIELGRYEDAERSIQRMLDLRPNLASYARASYYRELTGDLAGAVRAMRLAVSAGAGSPENVAYVGTLLGDLELARGRVAAAETAYREAQVAGSGYAPALAGLAKVDIARGRLAAASRRLRRSTRRLPILTNLTLLAQLELVRGRGRAARAALDGVDASVRSELAAGVTPDAEFVAIEATHGDPRRAVVLGRRVYRVAPSVRSADALGWALTRSGRPREGLVWARRAVRLGSRDPLFHYHAGMAARAAGDASLARRELRKALSLNPSFSPWLARKARRALQ